MATPTLAERTSPTLSDATRHPLDALIRAIEPQNADGSWNLPVPPTFVLDPGGVVRARHVDPDYRERMDPADILAALADLDRSAERRSARHEARRSSTVEDGLELGDGGGAGGAVGRLVQAAGQADGLVAA